MIPDRISRAIELDRAGERETPLVALADLVDKFLAARDAFERLGLKDADQKLSDAAELMDKLERDVRTAIGIRESTAARRTIGGPPGDPLWKSRVWSAIQQRANADRQRVSWLHRLWRRLRGGYR